MASAFFGLTIAYSGLQAANTSLNVAGHNISNINTDGYTRQQAEVTAADAVRTHATYGTIGSGVSVTDIIQTRNSYYDTKYRNNNSNYGHYTVSDNYMSQIQDYLNEFILDGYTKEYSNFYDAVNQLTLTPGDESSKNQLINNAKSFTDYFNTLSTNLKNVQIDANNEIKDCVEQINAYAVNISAINKQINQIEGNYGNANDLRDKRNAMIDELSELVNVEVSEEPIANGLTDYSVRINGQTLVSGYYHNSLQVVPREEKRNASDAGGLYDIQWQSGQDFNIYNNYLGGHLRGLVDIRDGCNSAKEYVAVDDDGNYVKDSDGNKVMTIKDEADKNTSYKGIPYYQSKLNSFISTFTNEVNKIMKSGVSSDGLYAGESLFVVANNTDTMTAANVTVNKNLLENPNKLAIKKVINTGEANELIMEDLNKLRDAKIFEGGNANYFLESIVSDMSIDAQKSENLYKNYNNLKTTIHNQRLSVMGVDTDEEAMSLIRYQQAYNLSSKLMSVMNQVYDKLINETGR